MTDARPAILILLSISLITDAALAAPAPTAARPKLNQVESYDNAANKEEPTKKLSTKIVKRAGSYLTYGTTLAYTAQQDLAQKVNPPTTGHRLTLGFSTSIYDRPVVPGFDEGLADELVNFTVMAAGQMRTIGNEVEDRRDGIVTMSDVDTSAAHVFDLGRAISASHSVELSLGSSFPLSYESQMEGVNAVPYAGATWAMIFRGGRAVITQGLNADYTANTYLYSPVSKQINSDYSAGYDLAGSLRLGYGFRFTLGGKARMVHHLDGTATPALANVSSLAWSRGLFTTSLKYSNGSRAEDRQTSLWFIDEYRQVVSFTMSVRF